MFENLADVESDMSVFHRIDDVREMTAQKFIDLGLRLTAYAGALRATYTREAEEGGEQQRADPSGNRSVPSDAGTLATDPGLGGVFEVVNRG